MNDASRASDETLGSAAGCLAALLLAFVVWGVVSVIGSCIVGSSTSGCERLARSSAARSEGRAAEYSGCFLRSIGSEV